jgi:hypothetical protein
MPCPIPVPAPVTIATFPANPFMLFSRQTLLLLWRCLHACLQVWMRDSRDAPQTQDLSSPMLCGRRFPEKRLQNAPGAEKQAGRRAINTLNRRSSARRGVYSEASDAAG